MSKASAIHSKLLNNKGIRDDMVSTQGRPPHFYKPTPPRSKGVQLTYTESLSITPLGDLCHKQGLHANRLLRGGSGGAGVINSRLLATFLAAPVGSEAVHVRPLSSYGGRGGLLTGWESDGMVDMPVSKTVCHVREGSIPSSPTNQRRRFYEHMQ